jgi:ribosome maturation factor RimP
VATAQREKEKELQREVTRLVERAVPGVEVIALEVAGGDRFCVFVDHPAGVDHALCERVTNVLRQYLDRYSIEVSSPGLDRPLRTRAHFEHALGRLVRIRTENGRTKGEVLDAGEHGVRIRAGTEPMEIAYDEIVRANMIHEGWEE